MRGQSARIVRVRHRPGWQRRGRRGSWSGDSGRTRDIRLMSRGQVGEYGREECLPSTGALPGSRAESCGAEELLRRCTHEGDAVPEELHQAASSAAWQKAVTDRRLLLHPLLARRWSPTIFDEFYEARVAEVESLLEAARWAPSAGNSQPW